MKSRNVLILPGWQVSGPQHWQGLWQARQGFQRVDQHDWLHPLRGDWIARLEDVVRTRVYLTDVNDCQAVSAVHGQYFGQIRPANTLLQVAGLVGAGYRVEIEAEAELGARA